MPDDGDEETETVAQPERIEFEPREPECWVADCARPRVDGVYCSTHARIRTLAAAARAWRAV